MNKNLTNSLLKVGILVSFIFDASFSQQKVNFSGVSGSNNKEKKKMKKTGFFHFLFFLIVRARNSRKINLLLRKASIKNE